MTPYTPTPLLPYTLAQAGDLTQGLILMVVGMFVVFAALTVLMILIAGVNELAKETPRLAPPPSPRPASRTPAPGSAPAPPTPATDPRLVAILTAAATATLKRPVAVRAVRYAGRSRDSTWARQGRRTIMSSHQPRRR